MSPHIGDKQAVPAPVLVFGLEAGRIQKIAAGAAMIGGGWQAKHDLVEYSLRGGW